MHFVLEQGQKRAGISLNDIAGGEDVVDKSDDPVPSNCSSQIFPLEPLIGNLGCSASAIKKNKVLSPEIDVYPNPVSDILHINSFANKPLNIKVYNLQGKELYRSAESSTIHQVNTEFFSPGLYLLSINQEGHEYRYKITKQ